MVSVHKIVYRLGLAGHDGTLSPSLLPYKLIIQNHPSVTYQINEREDDFRHNAGVQIQTQNEIGFTIALCVESCNKPSNRLPLVHQAKRHYKPIKIMQL